MPASCTSKFLNFNLAVDGLESLLERAAAKALVHFEAAHQRLPDRLAYSEAEAADLLGLNRHQLRDERVRGRIRAYTVVGGRIRYLREDILAYLVAHPWHPPGEEGVARDEPLLDTHPGRIDARH